MSNDFLDFSCYILTCARGLMDEPKIYGSFRMIEIFSKLVSILENYGISDEFLKKEKEKIDKEKGKIMESEEKFKEFLDELILEFTEELKKN